jgi:hypothetical protein
LPFSGLRWIDNGEATLATDRCASTGSRKAIMRGVTAAVLAWMLGLGGTGSAQPAKMTLDWPDRGYPALIKAATRARVAGQRLLIGLSGSDT